MTRTFPPCEQFCLTSQMRRAALSVLSNIAEGSGRNSDKDFAHYLEQAYGSLMEAAGQAFAALDERYIADEALEDYLGEAQRLAAQIAALNRSLKIPTSKVQLPESR